MRADLRKRIFIEVACVAFEQTSVFLAKTGCISLAYAAAMNLANPAEVRLDSRGLDSIFEGHDVAARNDVAGGDGSWSGHSK